MSPSFFRRSAVILLFAVLCTLLWGSAFPFVKLGYAAFGIGGDASVYTKLLFAGLRFGLAGVVVLAVGSIAARRPLGFRKSELGPILLVALVQRMLNEKGYSCGTADGIFGTKTESAVKSYQRAKGLSADGIVGTNTYAKLFTDCLLKRGSRGELVKALQTRLNEQGYGAPYARAHPHA